MYFTVKVDFVTQIITNSSSVVFSYADGNAFIEFVNELFSTLGVSKKCEDVFDVFTIPELDMFADYVLDSEDEELAHVYEGLGYRDRGAAVKKHVIDQTKRGVVFELGTVYDGYAHPTELLIVLKDGKDTKLGQMVQNIFSHEAGYNG
jgi:hypothetical protein